MILQVSLIISILSVSRYQARRQAIESEGDKLSAGGSGGAVSPLTG